MTEETSEKPKKFFTFFTIINILIFVSVIGINFYFFFFKKDFPFFVEVSCDETREQCFKRDCSDVDNCPPNGLETFKRYSIKASDFKYCVNEDCTEACEIGQIKCTQIKCIKDSETDWEELCFTE